MGDRAKFTAIRHWISRHENEILQLVADMVGINTVNQVDTGTEMEFQYYIQRVLGDSLGAEIDLFSPEDVPGFREHPAYYAGKDYTNRPNVTGRWRGRGGGRSLLFSSHADTAPVASGWSRDPWKPVLDGHRLYGLGSFDMKGGMAASIMAVRCLKETGIRLKGDVFIESVVDEEFGGANGTLAARLRGYAADAAIIPEPTNMAICPASRGGALWRITFRGNSGMSFGGEVIRNPVHEAGRFITFLEAFEHERSSTAGPAPWYVENGALPVIITRVEAGDMQARLCDSGPSECYVDIWVECYPGVTEEQLQEEIEQAYTRYRTRHGKSAGNDPTWKKMIRFLLGSETLPDFPLIGMLADEVAQVTGRKSVIQGAPFACDAFMFNLYSSTPAVILGPVGGNAHAPDEFIHIPSLYDLIEIYANTIISWCGIADEAEPEEGAPEKEERQNENIGENE